MIQEVEDFIKIFRSGETEKLFSEVACYWFAVILHKRFSYSSIYYNPHKVHFATEIDGILYDITGVIDDSEEDDYYDFERYKLQATPAEIELIRQNCVKLKGEVI